MSTFLLCLFGSEMQVSNSLNRLSFHFERFEFLLMYEVARLNASVILRAGVIGHNGGYVPVLINFDRDIEVVRRGRKRIRQDRSGCLHMFEKFRLRDRKANWNDHRLSLKRRSTSSQQQQSKRGDSEESQRAHAQCTSPGCDGFVEFGGGTIGAGKSMPAGWAGITSTGALGYFQTTA
jgi:hypothetical protein